MGYFSVSQVKKRVVQVISAMAHHGYLELEGGELLVRFIVQHCALHDTNQVTSVCLSLKFSTGWNVICVEVVNDYVLINLLYVYSCMGVLCIID